MEIWAHRGRTSPQELGNSVANFTSAYYLGVTGVETDVCLTKDGQVIIYHPGSTEPNLAEMTEIEIRRSIFNILTLDEFLNIMKQLPGLQCCLDLKQDNEELVAKTVKKVIAKDLHKRIYLTAFQKKMPLFGIESGAHLLTLARHYDHRVRTQMIVTWPYDLPGLAEEFRPDAMSIGWLLEPPLIRFISKSRFRLLDIFTDIRKQIAEVHSSKTKVWAGIFNDAEDMIYFFKLGVDGIMTDNPKLLKSLAQKSKIIDTYDLI